MTKFVFGTLTFAALMSLLLVKLFSQLAFADEQIDASHLAASAHYSGKSLNSRVEK